MTQPASSDVNGTVTTTIAVPPEAVARQHPPNPEGTRLPEPDEYETTWHTQTEQDNLTPTPTGSR
jgi:hypothetical protein